jgi:hypothetical protein
MRIVEGEVDDIDKYWCVIYVHAGTSNLYRQITVDSVWEMMVARQLKEGSTMEIKINGAPIYKIDGPTAWEFTPPIKLLPGTYELRITITGAEENGATIGGIRMWDTSKIKCMFKESSPFIQNLSINEHQILRGFNAFSVHNKGFASSKFNLVFNSDIDYLSFISKTDNVFIIQDEFGIWYRGVLEVSGSENIASDLIYVDCTFKSPYKAGIGW